MRIVRTAFLSTIGAIALGCWSAPASADTTADVYSDFRDVVGGLITAEFSESAAIWLTCLPLPRTPPRLGGGIVALQGDSRFAHVIFPRYYLRSIQRLKDQQWGALETTLRDDTTAFFADYIYYILDTTLTTQLDKTGRTITDPTPLFTFLKRDLDWTWQTSVDVDPPAGVADAPKASRPVRVPIERLCALAIDDRMPEKTETTDEATVLRSLNRSTARDKILQVIADQNPNAPTDVDTCSFAKDTAANAADQAACVLAQSVRAALQGKPAEAQAHVIDFVTRAMSASMGDGFGEIRERLRDRMVEWLRQPRDKAKESQLEEMVETINASLYGAAFDALKCEQSDAQERAKQMSAIQLEQGTPISEAAKNAFACLVTRASKPVDEAQFTFSYDKATYSLSVLDAIKAIPKLDVSEKVLAEGIVCAAKDPNNQAAPFCANGVAPKPEEDPINLNLSAVPVAQVTFKLTSLLGGAASTTTRNVDVKPCADPACKGGLPDIAPLGALMQVARLATSRRSDIASALEGVFFEPSNGGEDRKRLLRDYAKQALLVRRVLDDVRRLKIIAEDEKPDYAAFLQKTLQIVKDSPFLCQPAVAAEAKIKAAVESIRVNNSWSEDGATTLLSSRLRTELTDSQKLCLKLVKISDDILSAEKEISFVFASASRRDYRTLASHILEKSLPEGDSESATYRRLTIAFANYVLDEESEASDRGVSREAFRAAAIDTLRNTARHGLDRRPTRFWEAFGQRFYRSVALRASWNAAYHNQVGADGYRTVISFPSLVIDARFTSKDSPVYVGLDWSQLDLFGPLTELALRANTNTTYYSGSLVLAEFIRPRLDLVIGAPVFSEHLAISIGGSLRFDAPFQSAPGQFTYLPFFSTDPLAAHGRASFAEFDLGAHFVF